MSKYNLRIIFNNPDRLYRFTEEITGKVILDTQTDLTCKKMWINYGWRTHGRGNRDQGYQEKLTVLSEVSQFQSGHHREFPFAIMAPNGPMSYHGHILNVDWYIAAHVEIPFKRDIGVEQDFLLLPCESPEEICLGNTTLSKSELPIRSLSTRRSPQHLINSQSATVTSHGPKRNLFNIIGILLYVAGFLCYLGFVLTLIVYLHNLQWYIFVLFTFIAVLIYYLGFPRLLKAIIKTKTDIKTIGVEPSVLYLGDQLNCYIEFQTKSSIFLNNIEAKLWADETAGSGGGTRTIIHTYRAYERSFIKKYSEKLVTGRSILFDCRLLIPLDAPVSFVSSNNSIKWFGCIKLKFKRWPAWEKTFPITVLPS
jgi:hypothetical protein